MAEFKIELPVEVKDKGTTNSGTNTMSKLTGAVAAGSLAAKGVSVLLEGLMKTIEPLINILKALFVVIFLPLMPLIKVLTEAIGKLIEAISKSQQENVSKRDEMTFGLLKPKDTDSLTQSFFKAIGIVLIDTALLLGDGVTGILQLWFDFWVKLGDSLWSSMLEFKKFFRSKLKNLTKTIVDVLSNMFSFISNWFSEYIMTSFAWLSDVGQWIWGEILQPAFSWLSDVGEKIWNIIRNSLNFLSNLGQRIWKVIKSGLSFRGLFGGGKASGGPVSAGQTYMVGEKGPELFSPTSSGNIIPNNRLGGNNITINVSNNKFNSESDMRKLVDMISTRLSQDARRRFS